MNPKRAEARDESPFEGMRIDESTPLDELEGRSACAACRKSRKYFCYTCRLPVPELVGRLPVVELPLRIDIIKHGREIDGKSTAVHGALLAPNHVTIYTYPDVPDYVDERGAVLVYPSATASSVARVLGGARDERRADPHAGTLLKTRRRFEADDAPVRRLDRLPIERAVFIDSTWNQSRGIYKDERIRRLPCVVVQSRKSQFWRYQKGSPRWYLATIEAIHQFLLEVHASVWGVDPEYEGPHCDAYDRRPHENAYRGQYDNILFFFAHMYKKIHSFYEHDKLLAYKREF